jgi:hydrogenase expression/formation protein HypC
MCLGIPMQIKKIEGNAATVELNRISRRIYLDVLDEEVQVGDYVIVHAGFAINKVHEKEAGEILTLFKDAGLIFPDPEIRTNNEVH